MSTKKETKTPKTEAKTSGRSRRITEPGMSKAIQSFISRVVTSVVAWICLFLAYRLDLISSWLAIPIAAYFLAWVAFWAGALMQFLWTRGGGNDGSAE